MSVLGTAAHGGGCCGIKHVMGFDLYNPIEGSREAFIKDSLEKVTSIYVPDLNLRLVCISSYTKKAKAQGFTLDQYREQLIVAHKEKQRTWQTAVECVLAGSQYLVWKEPLENCGFKEVFSFRNSNSENMCHVFYGLTNPEIIKEKYKKAAT